MPLALSEPGAWLEAIHQHLGPATHDLASLMALVQLSKAQRMDLSSSPFSKDQGGEALGQVGLFS